MTALVGYTSEHGSTKGIAERIAAGLTEHGHKAEARPMAAVEDAGGYGAFVLGSAIHDGDWMPEAAAFLKENEKTLADRPVWLFSVGLARVLGGWAQKSAKVPKAIAAVQGAIAPREHRHLAGAVERDHFPLFGRAVFRLMGGRYGDFRDWNEIDAWVKEIAGVLEKHPAG